MQKLLDTMFPPFKVNEASIKANTSLSQQEQDLLLQIVADFEAKNENYDYRSALDAIAKIMVRYNSQSQEVESKSGKKVKIAIQPNTRPFLIKQVLFYMAVACKVYRLCTQATIIKELENRGVIISHNFFSSKMNMTPTNYYNVQRKKNLVTWDEYKKVLGFKKNAKVERNKIDRDKVNRLMLPTNYVGQKHEELAVAIRNLAYQAGKYDVFLDIFGGSGAATVAVCHNKDANYVYNEMNKAVHNLFEVLADDKLHIKLIEEVQALQADLRGSAEFLPADVLNDSAEVFYNRYGQRDSKEVTLIAESIVENEYDYNAVVGFMVAVRNYIVSQPDNFSYSFDGILYSKELLLKDIFPEVNADKSKMPGYACFMSFCRNIQLIDAFTLSTYIYDSSMGIYVNTAITKDNTSNQTVHDTLETSRQYRFYRYYAYFNNVLSDSNNLAKVGRVRYALAQLFLESFKTNGTTGISSILRMLMKSGGANAGSSDADNFIAKPFDIIIEDIHREISGTICENKDCVNVLQKYTKGGCAEIKHNLPLIYSDSPYAGTVDYGNEANNTKDFTDKDMERLINSLKISEAKFIFSCRAAQGSVNSSNTTEELKELNKVIMSTVFERFLKQFEEVGVNLYVLAVEKGGTLAELVKKNKISEIMITNYEICDFADTDYPKVGFKVYSFMDFLKILVDNLNI